MTIKRSYLIGAISIFLSISSSAAYSQEAMVASGQNNEQYIRPKDRKAELDAERAERRRKRAEAREKRLEEKFLKERAGEEAAANIEKDRLIRQSAHLKARIPPITAKNMFKTWRKHNVMTTGELQRARKYIVEQNLK